MTNEYDLPSRFGVTGTKAVELFAETGAVLAYADGTPIETPEKAEEINAEVWNDLVAGLNDPTDNELIQVARNPAISSSAEAARDHYLGMESAAVMEVEIDNDPSEQAVMSMDDDEPMPGDQAVMDDMSMDDEPTPDTDNKKKGPSL